jgi:hypothetical protein
MGQKSNRYLAENEQRQDLNASLDMKLRVGDRISKIIENQITFVDVEDKNVSNEIAGGVKLFSDSIDFLTDKEEEIIFIQKKPKNRPKPYDEDKSKHDRVREASVDADYILNGDETKFWKSRQKPKVYRYKSTKGSKVLTSLDE